MATNLEIKIQKLKDELKKKEALQQLKANAQRARAKARDRKVRNQRIYKLGGMVEKMGLDGLEDEILLGCFLKLHQALKSNPETMDGFRKHGIEYLPIGKRLEPVKSLGAVPQTP